jgi:tetratricopeptide (TPR) repeat protein
MNLQPEKKSTSRNHRRRLFRLFAVLLGLSVFPAADGVCLLFDWGQATDFDDPFVGFSEIYPLFVLDEEGQNYVISKSRRNFFAFDTFPAEKGSKTFRVFCLGGSTVQGRPYSIETSFTTWLQLSLTAADLSRDWDVVNCGGVSYASYRLVPILEECLTRYEPDLIVIYSGHNEFLEERTYDHIKHAPKIWSSIQQTLSKSRLFMLMREAVLKGTGSSQDSRQHDRPEMTADANALLDYKNGLAAYHRDDDWRAGVIAHYENNIRRMIAMTRKTGVPVLLIRPTSNLADNPPFKSQHRDDLTEKELQRWNVLVEQSHAFYRTDLDKSISLLNETLQIDDRYATVWYELGQCYETRGIRELAQQAYWRAREEDICPLRILEPMERALTKIARETNTPLIDAQKLLEQKESGGILGGYLLVDHIHPSFQGHQLIADAIARKMVQQGWLQPNDEWETRKTAAYAQQMSSLEYLYYAHGQRTLRALREWTKGRADGPPLEKRTPNGVFHEKKRNLPSTP